MNGLDLANQIMDFERRESLKHVLAEQSKKMLESAPKVVDAPADATPRTSSVRRNVEIPKPPDLKTHVIRNYDLGEIFDYINPKTLYSKHLGFQNYVEAFEAGDPKARDLHDASRKSRNRCSRAPTFPPTRFHTILPSAIRRRSHRHDFFTRRQDPAGDFRLRPAERRALLASPTTSRRATPAAPTTCACSSPRSAPACARSPRNGRTRATTCARTSCKSLRSREPRPSPSCCIKRSAR